jgi:hypothetical protein
LNSGDITLDIGADVISSGEGGRGMLLQSEGQNSSGKIAVTVRAGATVSTEADGYETIGFMDGEGNTLLNNGAVIKPEFDDALTGYVVRAENGSLGITNHGLLSGSILLGEEDSDGITKLLNTLDNLGTLGLGREVNLGSAGILTNASMMSAGGPGKIATSAVTGKIVQTATGTLGLDVNFGYQPDVGFSNDRIDVISGDVALAGMVAPNAMAGSVRGSGSSGNFAFLSAYDNFTYSDLDVRDSATVDYELFDVGGEFGANFLGLTWSINYTPDGASLTTNQLAFATYLNQHLIAERQLEIANPDGPDDLSWLDADLAAILNAPTDADLAALYQAYMTDAYFGPNYSAYLSSLSQTASMSSCPSSEAGALMSFDRQGSCLWLKGLAHHMERSSGSSMDFDETAAGLALGGQAELAPGLFGGLGFFYEDVDFSGQALNTADGYRAHLNAILKKELGRWTLSAKLGGGLSDFDHSRLAANGTSITSADQQVWMASAHFRAAYEQPIGQAYLRPSLGLMFDHFWNEEIDETGSPAAAHVDAYEQTITTLNPMLEIGRDFELDAMSGRIFASAGVLWIVDGNEFSHAVTFPGSNSTLSVTDELEPLLFDFNAGVNLGINDNASLKLSGTFRSGDDITSYGGSAKFSLNF